MRILKGFTLRDIMGQPTVVGEGVQQINFNKLITLNSTAAFLWKSIEQKEFSKENLAELLVEHYGIDYKEALSDATDIANEWINAGLIDK